MRELRNAGGEVQARIERGEALTVTRDGKPVGELHPLPRPRLTRDSLLSRWRAVPVVDPGRFRTDVADLDSEP